MRKSRCLVPAVDGAFLSRGWKEALWDKFYTVAPPRQGRSVERFSIVGRRQTKEKKSRHPYSRRYHMQLSVLFHPHPHGLSNSLAVVVHHELQAVPLLQQSGSFIRKITQVNIPAASEGLRIDVLSTISLEPAAARNWVNDWNFGQIRFLDSQSADAAKGLFRGNDSIDLVLIDRKAKIAKNWHGLANFPALELFLRQTLGTPVGMQRLGFYGANDPHP